MATDSDETIIDGLINYVEISGNQRDVHEGTAVYRSVADAFRPQISVGDTCSLAFHSMIIRPDIRTECFVAVLDSKVVVAWRKGLIKKYLQTEMIPKDRITSVVVEKSSSGATRGATLMRITAGSTMTFAIPPGRMDVGMAIRDAILLPH